MPLSDSDDEYLVEHQLEKVSVLLLDKLAQAKPDNIPRFCRDFFMQLADEGLVAVSAAHATLDGDAYREGSEWVQSVPVSDIINTWLEALLSQKPENPHTWSMTYFDDLFRGDAP